MKNDNQNDTLQVQVPCRDTQRSGSQHFRRETGDKPPDSAKRVPHNGETVSPKLRNWFPKTANNRPSSKRQPERSMPTGNCSRPRNYPRHEEPRLPCRGCRQVGGFFLLAHGHAAVPRGWHSASSAELTRDVRDHHADVPRKAPRGRPGTGFAVRHHKEWDNRGRERLLLRGSPRQGLEFAPVPDYPLPSPIIFATSRPTLDR
jgi:hypothetical protein